jgi:hypothetical protein
MKDRPVVLALLLVVGCAMLRLLGNLHPEILPGFTPCVALAFVGAAYLPHRWSWLVGVGAILLSELAFLKWNFFSEGHFFSVMPLFTIGFYALLGLAGILLPRRPALALLFGGPLLGSVLFYILGNTFSWLDTSSPSFTYPQNFAGWIQANTTGWPGYPPAWTFLRNSLVADLLFTTVLIAIFDPARLTPSTARTAAASR